MQERRTLQTNPKLIPERHQQNARHRQRRGYRSSPEAHCKLPFLMLSATLYSAVRQHRSG